MLKRVGAIFAGLFMLLLLSNISHNALIQPVSAQNTSTPLVANTSVSNTPSNTSSSITKLDGGIKILFPGKGDLVPLNSNNSLMIQGISKDNSTADCDVSIIINNVKPYQAVQPTGVQGNNDYSTWQYTVSSNYTTINEGNNKITSKIYCLSNGSQPSQAYYSINVTATNFTQAQLSSYNMMLESAANSTNNTGNISQTSNLQQPIAQIQQFNQDTGSGPICCNIAGAGNGLVNVAADTTTDVTEVPLDDTEVAVKEEEEEEEEEEVAVKEEEEEDNNRNDDEDNSSNDDDSGGSIMDDVEDTIRDSGIDFSFD